MYLYSIFQKRNLKNYIQSRYGIRSIFSISKDLLTNQRSKSKELEIMMATRFNESNAPLNRPWRQNHADEKSNIELFGHGEIISKEDVLPKHMLYIISQWVTSNYPYKQVSNTVKSIEIPFRSFPNTSIPFPSFLHDDNNNTKLNLG